MATTCVSDAYDTTVCTPPWHVPSHNTRTWQWYLPPWQIPLLLREPPYPALTKGPAEELLTPASGDDGGNEHNTASALTERARRTQISA